MPTTIHGVADAASAAAATTITKSGIRGQLGNAYIELPAITNTTAATGTSGTFELAVTATTGVAIGQRVTGSMLLLELV